ncbi:MAG: class I SAM-dependent methyltransferase [Planctomycetota bacterium]|nr:MAG: class I SAM-dependent methyltransferase [Planctomycetota bacterium]
MTNPDRPTWQLPPGVTRGLWDYVHAPHIADDYDEYFAYNRLFETDGAILRRHFKTPGLVADLGCGTGRALIPLVRAGHRGLAIDLSGHMLQIVREKAIAENLPIQCVRANLVELDAIADGVADYGMCLFSTLGMIRGRANRRRALTHARRILKPGGRFVLHVHNYWFNLRDPDGPGWVLWNLLSAPFRREVEIGDRWFPYRGLPTMYLHVFRWRELAADLHAAGFRISERIPLDAARREALKRPWLFGALRTNGWIVAADALPFRNEGPTARRRPLRSR